MEENDKLIQKLEQELKDFKEEVKEFGVDYAIDKAYELTVKQEVIDCIMYDNSLSKKQRKALLSSSHLLEQFYDEWLSTDGNLREHLNYSVDKTITYITDDYRKDKIKSKENSR